jgi:hypothetical protein
MALRLRRGIEAARTITPEQGELLYVTDTNKVYVGDGATPGGILVGPVDATLYDLLSDTTPQLGGNLDLNGRDITGTGNININGTITAKGIVNLGEQEVTLTLNNPVIVTQGDTITQLGTKANGIVKTSVNNGSTIVLIVTKLVSDFKTVAEIGTDPATLLRSNNEPLGGQPTNVSVSLADTISIGGKITSSFIPDIDDEYSIGTFDKQWANVWATQVNVDTTLAVGSQIIKLSNGSADSNLVLWDAETDTITAREFVGDVKGSVFADDSSVLVDAINGVFYGTIETGDLALGLSTITVINDNLDIGTEASPLSLSLNVASNLRIRSIADGINPEGYITLVTSRGTHAIPQALQQNDEIGGIVIRGYTNGSIAAIGGVISCFVADDAVIAGGNFIKTQIAISASTNTSQNPGDAFVLDSAGVATSNAFVANKFMQLPVYADDTARGVAIPTPAAGMIVFMTSGTVPTVTNKPVIYNGTAWEAF